MSMVLRNHGTKLAVPGLADEVAGLAALSFDELRARYRRLYRRAAPAGLSRDLIGRLVAHRLQEQLLGKLDDELARHLAKLARGHVTRRRIKTGSVLVREHDGVSHEVVIVPGGFLWNGETHPSLSTLAKRITGTTWNGPRFFGLRQPQAARVAP
ncbi:DUF2924 domain-containing protein [Bosea sp. PAMC 26642]|uniref:DUF2924 domain-containing protein n=1 Tax=Bosea sp. (strain PAMC 26642) TaxID=1792307 RepID=UPI0009EA6A72|nr:DUF2924 domain-containing protein [Bosea sp. PAMC 26642]